MHTGSLILLVGAAAAVAVFHSILPDHWVPLAVVARTQRWSLWRVAGISGLAAGGHVLASLALAGLVAVIGLRFQRQIEAQQGHVIGAVLVVTGLGFLVWGLAGHGHSHGHDHAPHASDDHDHEDADHDHGDHDHGDHDHGEHDHGDHDHGEHQPEIEVHDHPHGPAELAAGEHGHEHAHAERIHSHPHNHAAFVENRTRVLAQRSSQSGLAAKLATVAVPFGVAASPDLTILPVGLAASGYGLGAVITVLATFGVLTIATFVGLTVIATAAGYRVRGEWLEKNANTVTALVLIVIGGIAYLGF